jgi:hypothetical protein
MIFKIIEGFGPRRGTYCIAVCKGKNRIAHCWITKNLKTEVPKYDLIGESYEYYMKIFYYNSVRYAIQTLKKVFPNTKRSEIEFPTRRN